MTAKRTIGIDLGTTNSVVATIDADGRPRIIMSQAGDTKTPSCVSFIEEREGYSGPLIGEPARYMAISNPGQTIYAVKRLIGRRFDDPEVRQLAKRLPYEVVSAPNGDAWINIHGVALSPQEISALLIAEMKHVAESFFGDEIAEAIITVPAYFDNQQRQATVDAAEIAGLKVRRLLNEPTAAALGYGAHKGEDRRFAVCDLGGGTFDVSIVNVEAGVFEVISTHGDAFLGGDDIDREIIDKLVAEIREQTGYDLTTNSGALQTLKAEAQKAKHTLSELDEAVMQLPHLAALPSGKPLDYTRTLTRAELEAWSAPIIARLEPPCREALARCSLAPRDVDAVILVGGMTRMPAVQAKVARIFGKEPLNVANPDEIVSVGAAIQCAVLDGTIEGVVLLDVTSRAIGMVADGARYQRVIPRNATIPTREHKIIATTEDDQETLAFDVFEGESSRDSRHLGRFACTGLPKARAGEVLLLVDFTVDVDGILRVSTTELSSGERPELRLVATAGLTRADVRRLSKSMAEDR